MREFGAPSIIDCLRNSIIVNKSVYHHYLVQQFYTFLTGCHPKYDNNADHEF